MPFPLSLDAQVVEYVAAHRTMLGVAFAYAGTALGSTFTIGLLSLVIVVYFAHKHRRLVLPFIVMIAGSVASFEFLKDIVARPRPPLAYALYQAPLYSFPSGHATSATAFYGFLAYFLARGRPRGERYSIYIAAVLLVLFIGASRIYLGVHYPSDVVAGFALGGLWLAFGIWLIRPHHHVRS